MVPVMNEDSLRSILEPLTDGDRTFVPETWGQGRAVYGGLVAALGLRRARGLLASRADPRSGPAEETPRPSRVRGVHVWFTGPLAPGPVEVQAQLLRAGKSAISVESRLIQEGQERASVRVVMGTARPSEVRVPSPPAPDLPAPETAPETPFMEGVMPGFLRFFDVRWTSGDYPYSGSKNPIIEGWARCRMEGASGVEALALLADVWPSPAVPMLSSFAPASSMTWTLDIVGDLDSLDVTEWSRYSASLDAFGDGYGYMTAWNWGADGRPLARSTQLVAVYG